MAGGREAWKWINEVYVGSEISLLIFLLFRVCILLIQATLLNSKRIERVFGIYVNFPGLLICIFKTLFD